MFLVGWLALGAAASDLPDPQLLMDLGLNAAAEHSTRVNAAAFGTPNIFTMNAWATTARATGDDNYLLTYLRGPDAVWPEEELDWVQWRMGRRLVLDGEYEAAIGYLVEVSGGDNASGARLYEGIARQRLDDTKAASKAFKASMSAQDAHYGHALVGLAYSLLDEGRGDTSETYWELASSPSEAVWARARVELAWSQLEAGQFKTVLETIGPVLEASGQGSTWMPEADLLHVSAEGMQCRATQAVQSRRAVRERYAPLRAALADYLGEAPSADQAYTDWIEGEPDTEELPQGFYAHVRRNPELEPHVARIATIKKEKRGLSSKDWSASQRGLVIEGLDEDRAEARARAGLATLTQLRDEMVRIDALLSALESIRLGAGDSTGLRASITLEGPPRIEWPFNGAWWQDPRFRPPTPRCRR